ncbi:MAG TPA: phosphohydrolase [Clostridiales bacterium]|nr:phosphohydrolase [Clostridiales bacterium]
MIEVLKEKYPIEYKLIEKYAADILESDGMLIEKSINHHDIFTTFAHSVHVTVVSLRIVNIMKLKVDLSSLIRGSLLHDYFLYDWTNADKSHRLHAFFHSRKAYNNARLDFDLNKIEADIILKHMFPVTPIPPKFKESWIVGYADTLCTVKELQISLSLKLAKKARA